MNRERLLRAAKAFENENSLIFWSNMFRDHNGDISSILTTISMMSNVVNNLENHYYGYGGK